MTEQVDNINGYLRDSIASLDKIIADIDRINSGLRDFLSTVDRMLPRCACGTIMDAGERARGMCEECYDLTLELKADASISHEEHI